jgi:Common central domain of tyrosinase
VPALPPFVRQSIASPPAQITSLQHGIQVMMSRPASDPTSYRFQANIHGTYDSATTPQEMQSWNNCEHGSYYFPSWHRMYLYFFDRILRAAAGDPNVVLPYWNWTDPAQRTLPLPFRQPANASNPLYIAPTGRPAALDAGTASLGAGTVDFSVAFADVNFDSPTGSGVSFGGQIASPMQFNAAHGDFESQPHDVVHGALGGLMSDPFMFDQEPRERRAL